MLLWGSLDHKASVESSVGLERARVALSWPRGEGKSLCLFVMMSPPIEIRETL